MPQHGRDSRQNSRRVEEKPHKKGHSEKKVKKEKKESKASNALRSSSGPTRRPSPNSGGLSQYDGLPPARSDYNFRNPGLSVAKAQLGVQAATTGKTPKKKDKAWMAWWWWLKLAAAIAFVGGYAVGAVYLATEVIKAKATAEEGDNSEACRYLQCPSDSVCVDHSGKGHPICSENRYQNLQIMQIILGIVVGVPALICLPCTVQWVVNTGGPLVCRLYSDRKRKLRVASTARGIQRAQNQEVSAGDSACADDLEPGELRDGDDEANLEEENVGVMSRLLGRFRRKPKEVPAVIDEGAAPSPPALPVSGFDIPQSPVAEEDDMAMFFAPAKTGKKEENPMTASKDDDDFLDSIFASRTNAPPTMPAADDGLDAPDEDLRDDQLDDLDALFAKPVIAKAKPAEADDKSFDDFFHRPPRRGALPPAPAAVPAHGGMPAMPSSSPAIQRAGDMDAASRSEISAGLSAMFAQVTQKAAASRCSAGASRAGASRASRSRASRSSVSGSEAEEYDEEEYDDDEDYGEAPDFIGFALGIARATAHVDDASSIAQGTDIFATDPRASGLQDDWDKRSDASGASGIDSLADLEASPLSELFHPPCD